MTEKYSLELLRVVAAQISQTIGYSSTQSAPLELLQDILKRFIEELARDLHSQVEHANRVEPTLKDTQLSLQNLKINIHDVLNYISNVEPVAFVREIPSYPVVRKNSSMNFLKPGSVETLSRPVHIFEYLPPMYPTETNLLTSSKCSNQTEHSLLTNLRGEAMLDTDNEIKTGTIASLPKWNNHTELPMTSGDMSMEGHIVREISSVVMTTGGFISPAIEGKLPDAFVPDIIDKFKGLNAPVCSPQLESQPINGTFHSDLITSKRVGSMKSEPRSPGLYESVSRNEKICNVNIDNSVTAVSMEILSNKGSKKNKKKHFLGKRVNDQSDPSAKTQEKAQRKALKMYQKLSKNQTEGLKKSLKHVNRDLLISLPEGSTERLQLEKMIKKQAKQRQRHLKNKKQQPKMEPTIKLVADNNSLELSSISSFPVHKNESLSQSLPVQVENVTGAKICNINTLRSAESTGSLLIALSSELVPLAMIDEKDGTDDLRSDEIKLASEPDRIKLNIFKKISKQKTPKEQSPIPTSALNLSANVLFGCDQVGHVSSLINLPSGTTITPTPFSSVTEESSNISLPRTNLGMVTVDTMPYENHQTFSAALLASGNQLITEENKPKKRGRKPGGKNQPKHALVANASSSIINTSPSSLKKIKSSKLNTTQLTIAQTNVNLSFTKNVISMEPLNLTNMDELKIINNFQFGDNDGEIGMKAKEKKDKKRTKLKHSGGSIWKEPVQRFSSNPKDFNEKSSLINSDDVVQSKSATPETLVVTRNLQISPEKIRKSRDSKNSPIGANPPLDNNVSSSAKMYPTNQSTMLPMLPLLHFPPRPGLIPSGPGIFPSSLTSTIVPHTFMAFPPAAEIQSSLNPLPLPASADKLEDKKLEEQLTLSMSDRNYCNVAPLVPDSMKIPSEKNETAKDFSKNITKENSDFSIASNLIPENRGKLYIDSSRNKASAIGSGSLGDPIEVSDDSSDETMTRNQNFGNMPCVTSLKQSLSHSQAQYIETSTHQQGVPPNSNTSPSLSQQSVMTDSNYLKKMKKTIKAFGKSDNNNIGTAMTSASTPSHTFNVNFLGNDKFSLAGGADLIPLSRVDSGLAYSLQTVPASSLTAGATSGSIDLPSPNTKTLDDSSFSSSIIGTTSYDDITIIPTNNMNLGELKMKKMHKKLKKPKGNKIKKKKDKKDKSKYKDKLDEKHLLKINKSKAQEKKLKKDKKKEKQFTTNIGLHPNLNINPSAGLESNVNLGTTENSSAEPIQQATTSVAPLIEHTSTTQVPKLTLKLSGKSTPTPPATSSMTSTPASSSLITEHDLSTTITGHVPGLIRRGNRENSPELARFSPLVTGPPKPKQCELQATTVSTSVPVTVRSPNSLSVGSSNQVMLKHTLGSTATGWMLGSTASTTASSTLSASSVLLPQQLLQVATNSQLVSPSLIPSTSSSCLRPPISDSSPTELDRPSSYVDAEGYRIWICPACGKVDDGSAMIGCDGCDAWYHWICVGIVVAPSDNEDWFCRVCVSKKKTQGLEKKRRRNKKR
ncbi:bip2 [Drosophila busckii]|uniref:Bip2 n=1 Tax=Drosophila busckii TaxID=30019 RepID=A0A0M4ES84_DROBS|nr:uncharacterized protein LOC108607402 [Drosophila busckii]ALC48138.1 bip2 [Drosophila busckii]